MLPSRKLSLSSRQKQFPRRTAAGMVEERSSGSAQRRATGVWKNLLLHAAEEDGVPPADGKRMPPLPRGKGLRLRKMHHVDPVDIHAHEGTMSHDVEYDVKDTKLKRVEICTERAGAHSHVQAHIEAPSGSAAVVAQANSERRRRRRRRWVNVELCRQMRGDEIVDGPTINQHHQGNQ